MKTDNPVVSDDERVILLWQRPSIPDQSIPVALGIPDSLWAEQKRQGDTPPLFLIGRRLFVKTSDLLEWIDFKARTGLPGSKPMRAAKAAEQVAQDKPPGRKQRTDKEG